MVRSLFPLVVFVTLVLGSSLRADDSDVRNLVDLLPAETGLCIEMRNLRGVWDEVTDPDSEWNTRWNETGWAEEWADSSDRRTYERVRRDLRVLTGQSAEDFLGGLFGQECVIGVVPRQDGNAWGILLTRCVSAEHLHNALDAWKRAEPATWETLTHGEIRYFRRTREHENRDAEVLYGFAGDRELFLTDQQALLTAVLEIKSNSDVARLTTTEAWRKAEENREQTDFLSVFIAPRTWDGLIDDDLPTDPVGRALVATWRQVDYGWAAVSETGGLHGRCVFGMQQNVLSERLTSWLGDHQNASSPLRNAPADAIFASGGILPMSMIAATIERIAPEDRDWKRARQMGTGLLMGNDPIAQLLPKLGPRYGFWVVPPRENDPQRLLPATFWIDHTADEPLQAAISTGLSTGLGVLSAFWNSGRDTENSEPAIVRNRSHGGSTWWWLDGMKPIRPGFTVTTDRLSIVSSPELIDGMPVAVEKSLAQTEWVQALNATDRLSGQLIAVLRADRLRTLSANETMVARSEDFRNILKLLDVAYFSADLTPTTLTIRAGMQWLPESERSR